MRTSWQLIAMASFVVGCSDGERGADPLSTAFEFESGTYAISESGGEIQVSVSRSGDGKGQATVDYTSINETATAGEDYTPISGTLAWAAGDTAPREISVSVQDDVSVEGDESFRLMLSNPTGDALLGTQFTALVTVQDDDSPGSGPLTSGSLVPEFGNGGVLTSNPSPGWDAYYDAAIDGTYLYLAAWDETPGTDPDDCEPSSGIDWQIRLEKRTLATGALDPLFGNDGVVISDVSSGDDSPDGLAIKSPYVYVLGHDQKTGRDEQEWRVEKRDLETGELDVGFGSQGVITTARTRQVGWPYDIEIDATHLYVAGWTSGGRIEKRSLNDGSLDPAFGVIEIAGPSEIRSIAIDGPYLYAVGSDEVGPGDWQWRIEKRDVDDGSLVQEFGLNGDGVVNSNPSDLSDTASLVAVDSSHLYVAGWDGSTEHPSEWQWRIEKRQLVDGALVWVVTSAAGEPLSMVLDSEHLFVAGFDESQGIWQRRIEKRRLDDGSLEPGFGSGGVVVTNPSGGRDYIWRIALDDRYLYVAGEDDSTDCFGDTQMRIEKRLK